MSDKRKREHALKMAQERELWVSDARREFAACLARGDIKQAAFWANKVEAFTKAIEFWRASAASFAPQKEQATG